MPSSDLPYRPCVGIMLFNQDGKVFVGKRIDQTVEGWQMPQGGIDKGESPRQAALRELKEEVGTDKAEIIGEMEDWLTYDLPATWSASPSRASSVASARNGSPCASPARMTTSTSPRMNRNSRPGNGWRSTICRR